MTPDLTRETVLALAAGRELDALIEERVFGHRFYRTETGSLWSTDLPGYLFLPPYSTDLAAAWLVVEKLGRPRRRTMPGGILRLLMVLGGYLPARPVPTKKARNLSVPGQSAKR